MLFLLFGKNSFLAREKLYQIINHYQQAHPSGLNLKFFDFEKDSFEDLKNEIQTPSMFKEKKLLILKNAFLNQKFKDQFLKNKEIFLKSKDLILFYEKKELPFNDPLFQFLKKSARCQEFGELSPRKLENWIKKNFEKHQIKVSLPVIKYLANFYGKDLWQLDLEIKKLQALKVNQKNLQLKVEDLSLLSQPQLELEIFKTVDALAQKNKKMALKYLEQHLDRGQAPLYLLSMIAFQFKNLLLIKDLTQRKKSYQLILKKSALHPLLAKKSFWQAKKFTLEELRRIYQKIFETELKIKTGKIQPELGIELLISEL